MLVLSYARVLVIVIYTYGVLQTPQKIHFSSVDAKWTNGMWWQKYSAKWGGFKDCTTGVHVWQFPEMFQTAQTMEKVYTCLRQLNLRCS